MRFSWTTELFIKVSAFKHFLKYPQGPPAKPKETGYCIPDISKMEKIEGRGRFFDSNREERGAEVSLLYYHTLCGASFKLVYGKFR